MRLSSLFIQGNQVNTENTAIDAKTLEQNLKNGLEQVAGKMSGETVSGTIIEKNGLDVLISIGKNQLLQARLEGNMQVDIGQQLTFAIKNTIGNKVMLSPLFTNMANDPNISKALKMAGIPENETSVNMVKTMMQEGMSIDKNSLQQMMRAVNLNPKANVETLIQLTRLQIPITEESIFQLEAYKNYEHQLTEGIMTIADALSETRQGMYAEGNFSGGIALYKEVLLLLTEQAASVAETGKQPMTAETMQVPTETIQVATETGHMTYVAENEQEIFWGLGKEETATLTKHLKQAGFSELSDAVSKNFINTKTFFGELTKLLSIQNFSPKTEEAVGRLLESKEFNKLLKQEMKSEWMLMPEEVAEEKAVKSLYERLNSQLHRLSASIEQTATQTPLAKAVNTLTGNIDFMNQLNQLFTYIQIPLKLQGRDANSELYVYTNKKNLAKEDGEVSALLHLDMEHLGSVDVHVSMKENKVSTRFYLQDDSALDLIAENIDHLNERLNKRGYEMSASFIQRDTEKPMIEEILEQDKNISVLSGYSFDARA